MPFKYSCFISYRHSSNRSLQTKLVKSIHERLEDTLEQHNQKVFLDDKSLQKGYNLNDSIADELCRSAFMVLIYTPHYFDENYPWCAREYRAMLQLEKERFQSKYNFDRGFSFIIPIICSDGGPLQSNLQSNLYYNWTTHLRKGTKFPKSNQFHQDIVELAEHISKHCEQLDNLKDFCENCNNFTMPEVEETKKWIRTETGNYHQPFPGQ